jgi:hypothetical protein
MSIQKAQHNTIATRVGTIQSNSQSELEKDASELVDWYFNNCYNSGISTQRG